MASQPDETRKLQQVKLGPVAYSGFPVRRLTRPQYGECGEWITAYQAEQRNHLKAIMTSSKLDGQRSKVVYPPTNTREASYHAHTVLDTLFLLGTCYVDSPGDLSSANISGKELHDYRSDDFQKFDNVVSINASDNHLPLDAFHTFPSLQILELSLNFISDVNIEQGDFKHLHFLDLSYNNLSGMALLGLGTLPALKELHLTGNNLVALPAEMPMPYMVERGSDMAELRYPVLERLWLDDNKLSDQATFATLAGLRKLKYLNLNNNEIYNIPRLKLLGTNNLRPYSKSSTTTSSNHEREDPAVNTLQAPSLSQAGDFEAQSQKTDGESIHDSTTQQDTEQEDTGKHPRVLLRTASAPVSPVGQQSSGTASRLDYKLIRSHTKSLCLPSEQSSGGARPIASSMSTGSVPMGTSDANRSGLVSIPDSIHVTGSADRRGSVPIPGSNFDNLAVSNAADRGGDTKGTSVQFEGWSPTQITEDGSEGGANLLPFPVLETLSLVNNLILSSEGVVACGSWPTLLEIILYDNPLTRSSNGMPPLLQDYLVDQLGINVIRIKPQPLKCTVHIREAAKDFKKVSSAPPPTIPKHPLPAIEAPPTHLPALGHSPHPPGPGPGLSHTPLSSPSQQSLSSGSESTTSQESNGIFITQVTSGDEPTSQPTLQPKQPVESILEEPTVWSAKDTFRARLEELKLKYRHVPAKYKGYEALLEGGDKTVDNIPQDINGCTKALSYALKHPLVKSHHQSYLHPTTFPKIQGNHLQQKSKVIEPVGPRTARTSYKLTRLKKVLDDIRSQSHGVEANLAQVLTPHTPSEKKTAEKLQKEGKKLLAEMQAHYDRVRAASLEGVSPKSSTHDSINKRLKSVRFSGGVI